jgi:hypothetical protein
MYMPASYRQCLLYAAERASWRITLRQVDDDVVVGDPIVPRGSRPA